MYVTNITCHRGCMIFVAVLLENIRYGAIQNSMLHWTLTAFRRHFAHTASAAKCENGFSTGEFVTFLSALINFGFSKLPLEHSIQTVVKLTGQVTHGISAAEL